MSYTTPHRYGFTLVEVILVIVVIGILVGITAISYSGMQGRSRTTTADTAGMSVLTKAKTAYAATGQYPTSLTGSAGFDRNPDTTLASSGIALVASITSAPADPQTVSYGSCGTGARVIWWNYTASAPVQELLGEACGTYTAITGTP